MEKDLKKPKRLVDDAYRKWIKSRPFCCICGAPGEMHEDGKRYLDPSHVKSRGSGGGDQGNLVPKCRRHHTQFGTIGKKQFEMIHSVNLDERAAAYAEKYMKEKNEQRTPKS